MPRVTVALITYNRITYLKEAIEGVLAQSYKDFELIIMDNASTPETYDLVKPYLNDQVKYHRNPVNDRSYFNTAFDLASGEYLVIVHDDDIMKTQFLEKEVATLDKNSDYSIVATNITAIDEHSNLVKKHDQKMTKDRVWSKNEYIKEFFTKKILIPCPTVMFRKQVFLDHRLRFNMEVGPAIDLYLWLETNLLDYKICLLAEPLYKYRFHSGQENLVLQVGMEFSLYNHLLIFLTKNGFLEWIPKMQAQRRKIIFSNIANSYYRRFIDYTETKSLLNQLNLLGLKWNERSLKGLIKILIRKIR
jgi:glycosyltransferase involved in cell wall biosynthesis